MNANRVIHIIANLFGIPTALLLITTFFLNIIWVSYLALKIVKIYKNNCKQTLNSQPSYLSNLQLYNYRTHLTKYVLMCLCSVVQVLNITSCTVAALLHYILWNKNHNNSKIIPYDNSNGTCKLYGSQALLKSYPVYIVLINVNFVFLFLIFSIISISSRYLVARYLNFPFQHTLFKYLLWFGTQLLLITICSSAKTLIFSFFLFPIIALINLILLLRDILFLTRVVKSNLRNIQFFSFNKTLYKQELAIYKFYKFFRIFLLVYAFSTFLVINLYSVISLLQILIHDYCFLRALFPALHIPSQISFNHDTLFNQWGLVRDIVQLVQGILGLILALSLSVPLLITIISPVIYRCIKLCRQKEDQFRFNYDKLEPLLTRNRY